MNLEELMDWAILIFVLFGTYIGFGYMAWLSYEAGIVNVAYFWITLIVMCWFPWCIFMVLELRDKVRKLLHM